LRFFQEKYRKVRKAAVAAWVACALLGVVQVVGAAARDASAVLQRHRGQEWLRAAMAAADRAPFPALKKAEYLAIYLERGVVPALGASWGWGRTLLLLGYQVMAVLVAWAVFVKGCELVDRRRDRPAVGRWASTREVLSKFRPPKGQPSVYLCLYRPREFLQRAVRLWKPVELRMSMKDMVENVAIVGGIGAGKSWGVLIPMIASAAEDRSISVIAVDIKFGEPDCLTTAARFWEASGGTVAVWNPWDPNSVRVDILEGLDAESDDIWEHVSILMGHSPNQVSDQVLFWSTSEAVVMEALLRSALLEGRHMDRVRELSYLTPEALQKYIAILERSDIRRKLDRFFGLGYDKQAGSLYGLEKYLRDWDNPTVVRATTPGLPGETFELRSILREHTLFVIGIPQVKFVSGQSLVLFRLLLKTLTKMLLSPRAPDERQKVILVLEEFAQLERIPYFEQFLSSCRSRGVATVVTLQDIHRGYAVYGRDLFTGLLNNMRTVVLFPASLGPEEAMYFSHLLGQRSADAHSWTVGGPDPRASVSERAQPLVPAEDMRWGWKPGEVLVSTSGVPPFKAWCPPAITLKGFRDRLLAMTPPEDVIRGPDGRVDVRPMTMGRLKEAYQKAIFPKVFTRIVEDLARKRGVSVAEAVDMLFRGEGKEPVGAAVGVAGQGVATADTGPAVSGDGAGNLEALPGLERTPVRPPAEQGQDAEVNLEALPGSSPRNVEQSGESGQGTAVNLEALPGSGVAEGGAGSPGVAAGTGQVQKQSSGRVLTPKEFGSRLARFVAARVSEEPSEALAFEFKLAKDRGLVSMVVPRHFLEACFKESFREGLPMWLDMGWLQPVRGDRFSVTRKIWNECPAQDRDAVLRALVKGRQASRPDEERVSQEAASKFVALCMWISENLHLFDGSPSRDPSAEPVGKYQEGEFVSILPYQVHRVLGGTQEDNWPVWRQWADAGWIEVEAGRLTRKFSLSGNDRRRVVWIRWKAYQAASGGKVPERMQPVVVQDTLLK
jgi:hypothetical protein